jgi:SAM-dependent methyltransferase
MSNVITILKHSGIEWNASSNKGWVGGQYIVPNLSGGYHGILIQWLNYYSVDNCNCLLVSENKNVKDQFQKDYTSFKFKTLEFYEEMNSNVDLKYNLCESWDCNKIEKFDAILCQATFEHLYDPCMAMRNLSNILNLDGILLIHTHIPGMEYHPYPKDYLRFYPDWFFDADKFSDGLELIELITVDAHIFALYKKIGNSNV